MSSSLPPEIADLVIDQLHDEPTTLKSCSLVSKSWVPRTRSHLFAHVKFDDFESSQSWSEVFPDPSNSPAHHTHTLSIRNFSYVFVGTDAGDWIGTFHNVVRLHFERCTWRSSPADLDPLAPFFGFSPTVRSLRLVSTSFEVFDLICSFPLLEDLEFVDISTMDANYAWSAPPTSPKLTGSLNISTNGNGGTRFTIRRLLDFPDGLRFTKITLTCVGADFGLATDLVSRCSGTLESLNISRFLKATDRVHFPNLSRASKLKNLKFLGRRSNIHWMIAALRTIESKDLRQITIHLNTPPGLKNSTLDQQDWRDLDQLLVQFWTSHSIRPQLVYSPNSEGRDTRDSVPNLLPELTERGLVDLVEYSPLS